MSRGSMNPPEANERKRLFLRDVVAGFLCAVALGTATPANASEASTKASPSTLTFEDRVSYQRAIEEVYWRHRIWPKESTASKPTLDAVISDAQLRRKVEDYLRYSQVLQDYFQQPITAKQLQAEMDRMAKHTKQPDLLSELFEALGNDPFIIAECLARPALAERELTSWYAYDQRIHSDLKQRIDAELKIRVPPIASSGVEATIGQMKQLGGTYSEVEFIKSGSAKIGRLTADTLRLDSHGWDATVQRLAATFNELGSEKALPPAVPRSRFAQSFGSPDTSAPSRNTTTETYTNIPIGKLSPLRESEDCYYAITVTGKNKEQLRVASVRWAKEPLESWLSSKENEILALPATPNTSFSLPVISEVSGGCADNTWPPSSLNLPTPRIAHTAVWTGSEMIIWGGGFGYPSTNFNTGGRYNPSTDTWTNTSTTNAPIARGGHSAVWTGTQMIVWGGGWLNSGGRYNPETDSWTHTSTVNAPSRRSGHSAVWTGTQMIVWGGYNGTNYLNTGGKYNPTTDTWTATSTTNAPSPRLFQTAVWTGVRMIVWGGESDPSTFLNTGGRYTPSTDSWDSTGTVNAPGARELHTAVWTGSEMIIWGGSALSNFNLISGGKYTPATNTWVATSTAGAPSGRYYQTAVWTGSEMIIWGGQSATGFVNTGGRYNPGANAWTATSTVNAPPARWDPTAVWTGSEMIVWGGDGDSVSGSLNTGGRYNPTTNAWAPTQPPTGRLYHTALWTGTEMIIWGGFDGYYHLDTGGRYDAAEDSWSGTTITNAPDARSYHTAIWTGSEMIVWGGYGNFNSNVNTGGKYNPATNNWIATSTTNAPSGRVGHSGVWTGTEMVVWGGGDGLGNVLNTGGRYHPVTNTWIGMTTTNAPSARSAQTTVWTGNEMIIWGGSPDIGVYHNGLDTGGRYDPTADRWADTKTINAPTARFSHTATWTGTKMIIWGGEDSFDNLLGTGGQYDPVADSWTTTSIANAPSAREDHTAVWTGEKMIVWGGSDNLVFFLNSGGRYDPNTNSWTATSTANNVPFARWGHAAVWTGTEMIVWGGINGFGGAYLDNGGVYCADVAPTPTPIPTATATPTATAVPTATPTPCDGRCTPRPRPRPNPPPRP